MSLGLRGAVGMRGHFRIRSCAAWLAALAIVHLGATALLTDAASALGVRAAALAANGLIAPPTGRALDAVLAPSAPVLAAFAFTLSLGLAMALFAQLVADLLASASPWLRGLPVIAAVAAAATFGWQQDAPLLWAWIATAFLVPYAIQVVPARMPVPDARRAAGAWLGVVLLILPGAFAIGPEHLRHARSALLALPGGEAIVNAYYRHAMLAAEPIKTPRQRHYLTYFAPAGVGELPVWFQCTRHPLLLPVRDPRAAAVQIRAAASNRVQLVTMAGGKGFEINRTGKGWPGGLTGGDPRPFRVLIALSVVLGIGGGLAYAVALTVTAAVSRRRRWWSPAICAALGLAVALGLIAVDAAARPPPRVDGSGIERMRAAISASTTPAERKRLARQDDLLPVRAWALAARVRHASDPRALVDRVRSAPTWYEQWHGYGALLARGWHPAGACGHGAR